MPLYDYECDCGYSESEFDSMSGARRKKCPECKKITLTRLIGAGAGILFSSGFKDRSGEPVWFPKDGRPYFDQGLRRTFKNAAEKKSFMDSRNIISDGSMDGRKDIKKSRVDEAREAAREHVKKEKSNGKH